MDNNTRLLQIQQVIKDIENSSLSANQYFKERNVPFGYTQYYAYKKLIKEKGIKEVSDKRSQGNSLKFTIEMKGYVKGLLDNNLNLTSVALQGKIKTEFNTTISKTVINLFRQKNDLSWVRPAKRNELCESGASEILVALALHTGLISRFTDFIHSRVQNKKRTKLYKKSISFKKDNPNHRSKGKFTAQYNQLMKVRKSKFKSIDEKIPQKKFDVMRIFSLSEECLSKYCIALFALPMITSNGRSSNINNVKGNALKYLCGFNYKFSTIDKHIRELKYLQISDQLIETTAEFWLEFWKGRNKTDSIFACYYIDGNTKALWSPRRCYKSKVTMHGKIMNCIENLFIHDGQGHPIYFKTFNGHADLGKNGLEMVDKITDYLNAETNIKGQFALNRILIMDGGGNGVNILREIKDYYYITILDTNQINSRKLKCAYDEERYEYGDAHLIDCRIELKDSSDDYILDTRAIQVKWDNGRTSTLITNLPKEMFSTSNVVKSYFDRWPKQELDFKNMKKGVNIHRMVGYGKKLVENTKVLDKIEQLKPQMRDLKKKLKVPLAKIKRLERDCSSLIKIETKYRETSKIIKGTRVFESQIDEQKFKDTRKQLSKLAQKIKNIKKEDEDSFRAKKKKEDELARIIDKKKRYRVDVELDQLMTCFKLSFVNMCSYLNDECFAGNPMSLGTLFDSILDLRGKVKVEDNQRKIFINRNPKDPKVMTTLTRGLQVINKLRIRDLSGNIYHFCIV